MEVKVPRIPVMEVFGPTMQGEGRVVGQKTIFLRTGGCDYKCSWCDSKFTWDGSEKAKMMTADEVWARIQELAGDGNCNHVTISGGNPALVGTAMTALLVLLAEAGWKTSLETQGSRWQGWMLLIDDLCLSPKPPSSKMVTNYETLDMIIHQLRGFDLTLPQPYLKVVVFDRQDYEYAVSMHQRYPQLDFFLSVGNIDPNEEGSVTDRLLRSYSQLVDWVIEDPRMNNVKPLPQLHTLLWGNRRGV
jgi:7-carboxy-7-deazaguanine synthase